MKKSHKYALGLVGLAFSVLAVSGCTANFCNDQDQARILFAIEPGVSTYFDSYEDAIAVPEGNTYYVELALPSEHNTGLWRRIEMRNDEKRTFVKSNQLSTVINTVTTQGGYRPSIDYFKELDERVLLGALALNNEFGSTAYSAETLTATQANDVLVHYGYYKFTSADGKLWGNLEKLNSEIAYDIGAEKCPTSDFQKVYKQTLTTAIANLRSCIATQEGNYGSYGQDNVEVQITAKNYGDAWHKGFFEGLLVYPVAWLVDTFTNLFGGVHASGVPQLLALVVVTLIVRLVLFAATFKSTLNQQKMQALQPELAAIQAKYPNSNENQAQKAQLAQEQQALYKKHKINPLSQLLVIIIQFPVFICVWGAMTGSAALSTGTFLGLQLSSSIMSVLTNFAGWPGNAGWWTALVLFLLMSVSQFFSTKLPQWMQAARNKKVAKMGKNPAQDKNNRTMKIVSYVMLVFIIIMGFSLPAAMGVYWLITALIGMLQTVLTQTLLNRKPNKKSKK